MFRMDSIDAYAHLDSPLHRWDARYKLIGLMTLMFTFAFVKDLRLLPAMLGVTALFVVLSRLPVAFVVRRLSYPGLFVLLMALMLPFMAGETVILRLGPLAMRQEGILAVLLISTRFIAILTMGIVLFSTGRFMDSVGALHALGLPTILADMMTFFYRYLHDIARSSSTMQVAMRLRGFQVGRLHWRTMVALASLVGSLLVRSYEQSERVYRAMVLRGYGRAPRRRQRFPLRSRDAFALYGVILVACAFVAAEVLL